MIILPHKPVLNKTVLELSKTPPQIVTKTISIDLYVTTIFYP